MRILFFKYWTASEGFGVRDAAGNLVIHEDDRGDYRVRRYRPRIEGLFARIGRWISADNPVDVHWRSISKDNILTLYGKDESSGICDSDNHGHMVQLADLWYRLE